MHRPESPSQPQRTPEHREAVRRLLAELGRQLAAEERLLGEPTFEEIAAAVDGSLDDAARLVWEERVVRSPRLAERAAALEEFRAAQAAPRRLLAFPRRPAASPWFAWGAAAAALLVAALVVWNEPPDVAPKRAQVQPPAGEEILFADGFESGTLEDWTAGTPSG